MPNRKVSSREQRKVARVRNTLLGAVALVVVAVVAYGLLYSTGVSEGEIVAGEHYQVLEDAPGQRPGEPLLVREFFSYGCVHCRNFDPLVEDWQRSLPDDVRFERVPVVFSPAWTLLAQGYFALEELGALEQNHERLFRAIHDNRRQFASAEALADYVDGHGVSREQFLRAFESPTVRRQVQQADRDQRTYRISAVPSLVVANRYLVGMDVGRKSALDVVDHLLEQERSAARGQ